MRLQNLARPGSRSVGTESRRRQYQTESRWRGQIDQRPAPPTLSLPLLWRHRAGHTEVLRPKNPSGPSDNPTVDQKQPFPIEDGSWLRNAQGGDIVELDLQISAVGVEKVAYRLGFGSVINF